MGDLSEAQSITPSPAASHPRPRLRTNTTSSKTYVLFVAVCIVVGLWNVSISQIELLKQSLRVPPSSKSGPRGDVVTSTSIAKVDNAPSDVDPTKQPPGLLNCDAHNGPANDLAAEMVYWSEIPSDASFVSPFKGSQKQYLTFEPDNAGFNNFR
jgi:hypothetical protein